MEEDIEIEKPDLVTLAKEEAIKITTSQAIGEILHPITSEIAKFEIWSINKFKEYLKKKGLNRLAEKKKNTIEKVLQDTKENPEKLRKVEKIYIAMEEASEKELEYDEVLELWSAILEKINNGASDIDLMIEKLKSFSTAEAKFLLDFYSGKHRHINIHPFLIATSFRLKSKPEYERLQELALSLKEKSILIQPFPILNMVFAILTPILLFLLTAEIFRDIFKNIYGINVSSANNVILMGVLGVMMGFSLLPFLRRPARLSWLGVKLCDEIQLDNKEV